MNMEKVVCREMKAVPYLNRAMKKNGRDKQLDVES